MNERGDKLMRAFMASIQADREAKCQRTEQNAQLRKLVVDAIANLQKEAKIHVPEKGDFKTFYADFENLDKTINLSSLRLKVLPVELEWREEILYLELATFKNNCSHIAERVVFRGTKL